MRIDMKNRREILATGLGLLAAPLLPAATALTPKPDIYGRDALAAASPVHIPHFFLASSVDMPWTYRIATYDPSYLEVTEPIYPGVLKRTKYRGWKLARPEPPGFVRLEWLFKDWVVKAERMWGNDPEVFDPRNREAAGRDFAIREPEWPCDHLEYVIYVEATDIEDIQKSELWRPTALREYAATRHGRWLINYTIDMAYSIAHRDDSHPMFSELRADPMGQLVMDHVGPLRELFDFTNPRKRSNEDQELIYEYERSVDPWRDFPLTEPAGLPVYVGADGGGPAHP